jgi:hypothetical protein
LSYYFIILNIKQLKLKQDEKTNTTNKIDETTVLLTNKKEVDEGLSNVEKSLPSKYFMIKQEMLFYKTFYRVLCNRSEHEILKHKVRQL